MLSVTQLHGFGQPQPPPFEIPPLTPQEELEYTKFMTLGEKLERAYNVVMDAARKMHMTAILSPNGVIPAAWAQQYEAARTATIEASQPFLEAQAQVPRHLLPPDIAARQTPILPPKLEEIGGGLAGFGATELIPIQRLRFRVNGQSVPLASPGLAGYLAGPSFFSGGGLGAFPVLAVIILLGVVITPLAIGWAIKKWNESKVAEVRASVGKAEQATEQLRTANEINTSCLDRCIGNSTDPKVRENCTKTCAPITEKALETAREALESRKPKERGLGVLGTIGLVTVVSAAAIGGYLLYRRREERKRLQPALEPV